MNKPVIDNPMLALRMAQYANAAYCTTVNPKQIYPDMRCFDFLDPAVRNVGTAYTFGTGEAEGYVAHIAGPLGDRVVAFAGTNELGDWMTDTNVELCEGPLGVRMHRGFKLAGEKVVHQINDRLSRLFGTPSAPVSLTGHSLGAALCIYTALRRAEMFGERSVKDVWLYGCPRVLSRKSYRTYDKMFADRTQRFVHESDVVTCVPHMGLFLSTKKFLGLRWPTSLPEYYHHVEGLRWWNGSEWRRTKPFFKRLWVYLTKRRGVFNAIDDHTMGQYIQALKQEQ